MKKQIIAWCAIMALLTVYVPRVSAIQSGVMQAELSDGGHAVALTTDGTLYTWGHNDYGQLGRDGAEIQPTPQAVLYNIRQVAVGTFFTLALADSGELYAFGGYSRTEGMNATEAIYQSKPTLILSSVASIAAHGMNAAAITQDGSLYLWGNNLGGMVGMGSIQQPYENEPVKVMGEVAQVALGDLNTAAITRNGDLFIWGNTTYGQIGNGTFGENASPQTTPVKVMNHVIQVALGYGTTLALQESGKVYAWGSNAWGGLGDGESAIQATPQLLMEDVCDVYACGTTYGALNKSETLYLWGTNEDGQVGCGKITEIQNTPSPVQKEVLSASLGGPISAAVTRNGDLYLWGRSRFPGEPVYTPEKILEEVQQVSCSASGVIAITKDGTLYVWGNNFYGQIGSGEWGEGLYCAEPYAALTASDAGPFPDVSMGSWYASDVRWAVDSGLIHGRSKTQFAPTSNITWAETVKLASCARAQYLKAPIRLENGTPWYKTYVDYALESGIISRIEQNPDQIVNREMFAAIFAHALPEEAYPALVDLKANGIPDYPSSASRAAEVYKLYRAGILTGSGNKETMGFFLPNQPILRSEAAAILHRLMVPDVR